MNSHPIGVFDSGVGGIPVLSKLADRFGGENFIYLGDNGNVPYGSRSEDEICELAKANIKRLEACRVKAVVIACNTASLALVGKDLGCGVPVIPLIPYIPRSLQHKRGLFFATPATVRAIKITGLFKDFDDLTYFPLPSLASSVEESLALGQEPDFFADFLPIFAPRDFIYLGCTHYLYLEKQFSAALKCDKILDGSDKLIEKLTNCVNLTPSINTAKATVRFIGEYAGYNCKIYKQLFF